MKPLRLTRRTFLATSGAAALAPNFVRAYGKSDKLNIAVIGSRLPFHSSSRVIVRRAVRMISLRITVARGRSSHTTVSARSQTRSRTAV